MELGIFYSDVISSSGSLEYLLEEVDLSDWKFGIRYRFYSVILSLVNMPLYRLCRFSCSEAIILRLSRSLFVMNDRFSKLMDVFLP